MLLRNHSIKFKSVIADNAVSNPTRKKKSDKKRKSHETEVDSS
jgi:hypothetical protein